MLSFRMEICIVTIASLNALDNLPCGTFQFEFFRVSLELFRRALAQGAGIFNF